jgi:hypothetical protein
LRSPGRTSRRTGITCRVAGGTGCSGPSESGKPPLPAQRHTGKPVSTRLAGRQEPPSESGADGGSVCPPSYPTQSGLRGPTVIARGRMRQCGAACGLPHPVHRPRPAPARRKRHLVRVPAVRAPGIWAATPAGAIDMLVDGTAAIGKVLRARGRFMAG